MKTLKSKKFVTLSNAPFNSRLSAFEAKKLASQFTKELVITAEYDERVLSFNIIENGVSNKKSIEFKTKTRNQFVSFIKYMINIAKDLNFGETKVFEGIEFSKNSIKINNQSFMFSSELRSEAFKGLVFNQNTL